MALQTTRLRLLTRKVFSRTRTQATQDPLRTLRLTTPGIVLWGAQ
jgi:hypothetical protein